MNKFLFIFVFFYYLSSLPIYALSDDDKLAIGKSLFEKPWIASPASTTARDGLGPLFNQNACINCHPTKNRRQGNSSDKLIIKPDNPNTIYGEQIATQSSNGFKKEANIKVTYKKAKTITYLNGDKVILKKPVITLKNLGYGELNTGLSIRISPDLNGVSLLEKITNKPSKRFNLTSGASSILQQAAGAAYNDMGLTSLLHPKEDCNKEQKKCLLFANNELDLPMHRLEAITYFVKSLNQVSSKKPIKLFKQIGCDNCHTSSYNVNNNGKKQMIYPYTDLLTHNLGDGKFRTAPLWNSSKKTNFWHDGRAKTIEEAILWHQKNGKYAKTAFINLSKNQRTKLLNFLRTL